MNNYKGFTLIELLTVITIIIILLGIGVPAYNSWRQRAKIAKARATIAKIEMALEMYKTDAGQYPPKGEDLNNPADPVLKQYLSSYMNFKKENMGTADKIYNSAGKVLLDPWGYYYTVLVESVYAPPLDFAHNRSSCYIYSRGPDGKRDDCVPDASNPNDVDNDNIDNYNPM